MMKSTLVILISLIITTLLWGCKKEDGNSNNGGGVSPTQYLWTKVIAPIPTNYNLNDVCKGSVQTIIIVGDSGTILQSKDGGLIWTNQITSISENLVATAFNNNNYGAAVGENGAILVTSNCGETWMDFSQDSDYQFLCIAISDNHDLLIGGYKKSDNQGVIIKFTPSNDSLSVLKSIPALAGEEPFIKKIIKTDNGNIQAITSNGYYYSSQDWALWDSTKIENPNSKLTAFTLIESGNKWISDDAGNIYCFNESSESWTNCFSSNTINISTINMENNDHGRVAGKNGIILRTADNWQEFVVEPTNSSSNLLDLIFINETIGIAVGEDATLLINLYQAP